VTSTLAPSPVRHEPGSLATQVSIVVPTVGRASLDRLLASLREAGASCAVVVVEDRHRRGPAAARNAGWRATTTPWVVFLDDDVEVTPRWWSALADDLTAAEAPGAGPAVGAVQGRIHVPLPTHRRPTDRERNVAGLEGAPWITADMAVRRDVLDAIGGFDERFPRAYREDSDLALRILDAGWRLELGDRGVLHPVQPAPWSISIRAQRGNADDALMRRLHGRGWRARAGATRGAIRRHVATTFAGVAALALARTHPRASAVAALVWATLTARFWWARVRPGPRTGPELATMAVTSVAIPPAAVGWWIAGRARAARLARASHG
jgi:hypothetical protein